jgi:hypothetical protein
VLTTVRVLVDRLGNRLSTAVLLAAVFALTVGSGVLPALSVMLGDCPVSGSTGC